MTVKIVKKTVVSEEEYQSSKSLERKQLDNASLSLITRLNSEYPGLNLLYTDSTYTGMLKAVSIGMDAQIAAQLIVLKELVGDSRLPSAPHNI